MKVVMSMAEFRQYTEQMNKFKLQIAELTKSLQSSRLEVFDQKDKQSICMKEVELQKKRVEDIAVEVRVARAQVVVERLDNSQNEVKMSEYEEKITSLVNENGSLSRRFELANTTICQQSERLQELNTQLSSKSCAYQDVCNKLNKLEKRIKRNGHRAKTRK